MILNESSSRIRDSRRVNTSFRGLGSMRLGRVTVKVGNPVGKFLEGGRVGRINKAKHTLDEECQYYLIG